MQRFVKKRAWVGDKTFTTLINTSYSMKGTGQTSESNMDSGLLSNPLSFLRSTEYTSENAKVNTEQLGRSWTSESRDETLSYPLVFGYNHLYKTAYVSRGLGFAVRCVVTPNGLVVSLPILYVQKAGNYLLTKATNPSSDPFILAIL